MILYKETLEMKNNKFKMQKKYQNKYKKTRRSSKMLKIVKNNNSYYFTIARIYNNKK